MTPKFKEGDIIVHKIDVHYDVLVMEVNAKNYRLCRDRGLEDLHYWDLSQSVAEKYFRKRTKLERALA